MKRIALATVSLVAAAALVGCSASSEVEAAPAQAEAVEPARIKAREDAEAGYLAGLVASMPPGAGSEESRAAVLDLGYGMCDSARENRTTTEETAQLYNDAL